MTLKLPASRSLRTRALLTALSALPLAGAPSAMAAVLAWDANTGLAGAQDGSGSEWSTTDVNWWNGSADVAWPNNDTAEAVFGAGSGAAGPVTVGTVTTHKITFNAAGSGTYTLNGGTITFAGATPTIKANVAATIGSTVNAPGATTDLTAQGAGLLTLAGGGTIGRNMLVAGAGTAGGAGSAISLNAAGTPGVDGPAGHVAIPSNILHVTSAIMSGGDGGTGGAAGVATVIANPGGAGGKGGAGSMEVSLTGSVVADGLIRLGGTGGAGGQGAGVSLIGASGGLGGDAGAGTLLVSGGSVKALSLALGGNGGDGGDAGLLNLLATGANGGKGGNGTLTLSGGLVEVTTDVTLGGIQGTAGSSSIIPIIGTTIDGGEGGEGGVGTLNLGGTGSLKVSGNITIRNTGSTPATTSTLNIGSTAGGAGTTAGTLALTGSITNNGAIHFRQTDTTSLSNLISGAGTVTQEGPGTTVLTGNKTYTGATTVSNGTLHFTGLLASAITVNTPAMGTRAVLSGTGTTSQNITLNAGSTILGGAIGGDVGGANVTANTAAGVKVVIAGSDGINDTSLGNSHTLYVIRHTGTGPTLANFDTSGYRSPTLVDTLNEVKLTYTSRALVWNGGASDTWNVGAGGSATAWQAGEKFFQGDVVTFNDTAGAGAHAVNLNALVTPGAIIFDNDASTYTVDGTGSIAGATGITQSGDGTTILSTDNLYTGHTRIQDGVLVLDSAQAVTGGAAGSAGGWGSDIEVSGGGVIGLGTGNSTFTRELGALGSANKDTITFAGSGGFAAYVPNATVNLGGAGATLAWASTPGFLADTQALVLGAADATGTVDFQNAIALNGGQRTVQVDHDGVDSVDAILSGGLTGDINSGLAKTGDGTLALTGAGAYGGDTHVAAGELLIGNGLAAGTLATGTVTVDGPATLTVGGGTAASSLTSSGLFTNAGTFNVGDGDGAGGSAVANINGGLTGAGDVAVEDDGTLNLNSAVAIGGTLTNAGTTQVKDAATSVAGLLTNTGSLLVGNTLGGIGSAALNADGGLANDGTVTVQGPDGLLHISTDISGTGTLATLAGGALALDNVASVTNVLNNAGTTTLADGTTSFAGVIVNTGTFTVGDTIEGPGTAVANINGGFSGAGNVAVESDGALILNSPATLGGTLTNAGTVVVADDTADFNGPVTNTGTFTVGNGDSTPAVANINAGLTGAGGVTVDSDGTLNLNSDSAIGGTLTNDGTINVAPTVALEIASGVSGGGTIANSGDLVFTNTIPMSVTNDISGTGTVTQAGTGTTSLTGANTYAGNTYVNAGVLLVNGTNTGSGDYIVGNGLAPAPDTLGGTGTITTTGTVTINGGDGDSGTSGTQTNGQITGGDLGTVGDLTITAAQVNLHGTYIFDVDYGDLGPGPGPGQEDGDTLFFTGAVDLTGAVFQLGNEDGSTVAGEHYAIKIFESASLPTGGPPIFQLSAAAIARGQSVVTWDGGLTYYLVPEPASFALLGLGSLLLLRRPTRRRGRQATA